MASSAHYYESLLRHALAGDDNATVIIHGLCEQRAAAEKVLEVLDKLKGDFPAQDIDHWRQAIGEMHAAATTRPRTQFE